VSATTQGIAVFASAREAAAEYISDGTTSHARKARDRSVRRFHDTFGSVAGWAAAPLSRRLTAPADVRGVAVWLVLATATPVDPAYVAQSHAGWGYRLAGLSPDLSVTFTSAAARIGWNDVQSERQWALLAKLAAVAGRPAEALTRPYFDAACDALAEAVKAARGRVPNTVTTPLHGLRATLAAMGVLDEPGGKRVTGPSRPGHWQELQQQAPELAGTMRRYLAQLAISMRPSSVGLIDTTLRHLASYLTGCHPGITAASQIRRTHIEGFKAWLAARPGYRGRRGPAKTTIGMRLGHVRGFFDRITEWGYDDSPPGNPVFLGDIPIRDHPLPRFLGDADFAKLLAAARRQPSLLDRVCVEVLARTGIFSGGANQDAQHVLPDLPGQ